VGRLHTAGELVAKSIYSKRYRQFLDLLIQARKEADLTQVEVASRLDRPQSFVSKYENGERRLDVVEFLDVAKAIDFDAVKLMRKLT
jgi:transcriptional regulator with XRE-family HTH domain